jgi:putative membrane protein (TIGR04086 family)
MGKRMGRRRFLWGILMGAVYFLVLLAGSILLNKGVTSDALHMGTTLVMCMASGMIGGMLS